MASAATLDVRSVTREQLVELHRRLFLPRLIEEKMLKLLRQGALDTPVPCAKALERQYLPTERLREKLEELLAY